MQLIGVDTGGTFTDVIVVADDGEVSVGKALSTPGRIEEGVFAGLAQAAQGRGVTLTELLSRSDVLAHGTTAGLNALLTGSGARVGLLTTKGFESTLAIAKANKMHGLPADDLGGPARWGEPDCSSAARTPGGSAVGSTPPATRSSRWTRPAPPRRPRPARRRGGGPRDLPFVVGLQPGARTARRRTGPRDRADAARGGLAPGGRPSASTSGRPPRSSTRTSGRWSATTWSGWRPGYGSAAFAAAA